MEYGMDTVFVQCQEQLVTNFPVRHQQVVKVMVRLAFRRDMRPHDMSLLLELLELLVVELVSLLAGPVNLLDRFQLGQQEGTGQFTWQVGRSLVNPAVLVDLAGEKSGPAIDF
tara:strand:- start:79 stop:417 length:339 start_codon:yes stop_codon:yes gene_type:complete